MYLLIFSVLIYIISDAAEGKKILNFGPSVLRATSGLAEQLRETIILGIFPLLLVVGAGDALMLLPQKGLS